MFTFNCAKIRRNLFYHMVYVDKIVIVNKPTNAQRTVRCIISMKNICTIKQFQENCTDIGTILQLSNLIQANISPLAIMNKMDTGGFW